MNINKALDIDLGSGPRGDGDLDFAQYEAVAFELEAVAVAVGLYDSNRLGNSSSVWCYVHKGYLSPGLLKFTTLGRSICTFSMDYS